MICPRCAYKVHKKGYHKGIQRWKCRACQWHGVDCVEDAERRVATFKGSRRFVITSAQNATPIHKSFLAALKVYCEATGAKLLVVPFRYHNPTSIWTERDQDNDWWDAALVPHLVDQRVQLCRGLVLLGDIKTQPTAVSPLTGFESLAGPDSAIIGHPKLELTTVATPQHAMAKILTTTGAITKANYIPSKAGKKAEFHHIFGACVVEIGKDKYHIRQINAASNGSFQDLDTVYTSTGTHPGTVDALIMGDLHEELVDPNVVAATFTRSDSIVKTLKPKRLVWHDVHEFYSRNHHHRGEVFINYAKHHAGADNVEKALDGTFAFIDKHTPPGVTNIFVPSNHPDALARWVKEADPKNDPENAVFWARTFEAMCLHSKMGKAGATTVDPFAYWGKRKLKCADRSIFLNRDQSYTVHGIELCHHGDKGINGARGSRAALAKIGVKTVIGHSHSPGIVHGCMQVGTSSYLRLEYNKGPSSWMQTHALIYGTKKRSLIFIIDGDWRA